MRLLISGSWVRAPRWATLCYVSIRQFMPIDQTLSPTKREYKTKNTSATTTVWVRHQLLLNCSVHIAFPKFSFGAICFPDIVTDISFDFCAEKRSENKPSHQIGLQKEIQCKAVKRESALETSHKSEPMPNVGLEPTALRLGVSFSTD